MADYFSSSRRRSNVVDPNRLNAPVPPNPRPVPSRENLRPPSSIRIRRLPSSTPQSSRPVSQASDGEPGVVDFATSSRRRSSSAPQGYQQNLAPPATDLARQQTVEGVGHMGTISEGVAHNAQTPYYDAIEPSEIPRPVTPSINLEPSTPIGEPVSRIPSSVNVTQNAGLTAQRTRGLSRIRSSISHRAPDRNVAADEYGADVVGLLDLLDPEVRTIGTLTNVQNSLFVPDLGGLINRRPTYDLTTRAGDVERRTRSRAGTRTSRPASSRLPTITQGEPVSAQDIEMQEPRRPRTTSISSRLSDSHYAVLPPGVDLEDWTQEDIDELNDHVRHLLHSRREGFKRGMRGFRKYLSRPLGLFVFTYATLVTLFGAAWVFCLIGWIYVGSKQDYFIDVIDNILVALFALMGDGLAPFRAVDTYHMCFIAHYHHLTWRLRKEKKLPELVDENDLPERRASVTEVEDAIDRAETAEFSVLSPRQQRRLQYHQAKFSKAHTFYKPHETATHHAFPLRLLVAVVVLLDFHSFFQMALGTCTWSINYKVRPQALTATILACSLTCNITAGVLISIGDHRTRKKDVLERIFRQSLTREAIEHVEENRRKTFETQREQEDNVAADNHVVNGTSTGIDLDKEPFPSYNAEQNREMPKLAA